LKEKSLKFSVRSGRTVRFCTGAYLYAPDIKSLVLPNLPNIPRAYFYAPDSQHSAIGDFDASRF